MSAQSPLPLSLSNSSLSSSSDPFEGLDFGPAEKTPLRQANTVHTLRATLHQAKKLEFFSQDPPLGRVGRGAADGDGRPVDDGGAGEGADDLLVSGWTELSVDARNISSMMEAMAGGSLAGSSQQTTPVRVRAGGGFGRDAPSPTFSPFVSELTREERMAMARRLAEVERRPLSATSSPSRPPRANTSSAPPTTSTTASTSQDQQGQQQNLHPQNQHQPQSVRNAVFGVVHAELTQLHHALQRQAKALKEREENLARKERERAAEAVALLAKQEKAFAAQRAEMEEKVRAKAAAYEELDRKYRRLQHAYKELKQAGEASRAQVDEQKEQTRAAREQCSLLKARIDQMAAREAAVKEHIREKPAPTAPAAVAAAAAASGPNHALAASNPSKAISRAYGHVTDLFALVQGLLVEEDLAGGFILKEDPAIGAAPQEDPVAVMAVVGGLLPLLSAKPPALQARVLVYALRRCVVSEAGLPLWPAAGAEDSDGRRVQLGPRVAAAVLRHYGGDSGPAAVAAGPSAVGDFLASPSPSVRVLASLLVLSLSGDPAWRSRCTGVIRREATLHGHIRQLLVHVRACVVLREALAQAAHQGAVEVAVEITALLLVLAGEGDSQAEVLESLATKPFFAAFARALQLPEGPAALHIWEHLIVVLQRISEMQGVQTLFKRGERSIAALLEDRLNHTQVLDNNFLRANILSIQENVAM
jgi:hypothetical protein